MKSAIFQLLMLGMCTACSMADYSMDSSASGIQASRNPVLVAKYLQGHWQSVWDEEVLKEMFRPIPANQISNVEIVQIDGEMYLEAVQANARWYIDLILQISDSTLYLGDRLQGCTSDNNCKDCRLTSGDCWCNVGMNDCDHPSQMIIWPD